MSIRVRFAPSPTGNLHIGGARTALFNLLFAKKNKGTLLLRIEDTDIERNTQQALISQLKDLKWLGINFNEGVMEDGVTEKGNLGPYKQSKRLKIYKQYLNYLIENNKAYYCFLSSEEIDHEKQLCIKNNKPYRPSSKYRNMPLTEAKELIKHNQYVIRLKSPETNNQYQIKDIVRGDVKFDSQQAGDFVISRSNGMPMYNFCCVIDDHLMNISHVFRGEEHLTNTFKQLMLYEALNFQPPTFAHTSIILNTSGKKLSKRDGAVSCDYYKEKGYLPSAVINYMALLGWNDGTEKEIYNLDELINKFSLQNLNPTSPIFDEKKLSWINQQHIQQLSPNDLWQHIKPFIETVIPETYKPNWHLEFTKSFATTFTTLLDAKKTFEQLTNTTLEFNSNSTEVLTWGESSKVISTWIKHLSVSKTESLNEDWLTATIKNIQQETECKGKKLFMPLRVAMIGEQHGAELKILINLLPKNTLITRAQKCIEKINSLKVS